MRSLVKKLFWRYLPEHLHKEVRTWLWDDSAGQQLLFRDRFFKHAYTVLKFNGIAGDYAEFGSHLGRTFSMSYHAARRAGHSPHLWAFDSFQGLPAQKVEQDRHPVWREGRMATTVEGFHQICRSSGIPRASYTTIEGFYEDTLPAMSPAQGPTNIALAYIDCDLYSSTKTVLTFLAPRLKHGMILGFDDYYNWSDSAIAGERRAMLEVFRDNDRWHLLPYLQIGWTGMSFVVEDKNLIPK